MTLNIILLIAMTLAALWTVMARSVLKSAIGLAITSAVITILMFRLSSPLAAIFELSICTGLITAVFVSAISLTKPMTHRETIELTKNRLKRYWPLPVIMAAAAIILVLSKIQIGLQLPQKVMDADVRYILWNLRELDLLGQIVLLLAGAFGVVILFRETGKNE